MKFRLSNYGYHVIYAAKFEFISFWSLGDTKSQRYPSHERNKSSNSDIYPWKMCLTLKKIIFFVRPKIELPYQFQQFLSRGKIFSFQFFKTSRLDG